MHKKYNRSIPQKNSKWMLAMMHIMVAFEVFGWSIFELAAKHRRRIGTGTPRSPHPGPRRSTLTTTVTPRSPSCWAAVGAPRGSCGPSQGWTGLPETPRLVGRTSPPPPHHPGGLVGRNPHPCRLSPVSGEADFDVGFLSAPFLWWGEGWSYLPASRPSLGHP